jgi:fibronectin-binding autotransporter adhesin
VAPGNSPGCLNSSNLVMAGALDEEIGGTTACTGYDQLKVTGTVNVTSAALNTTLVNSFSPAVNDSFTIVDNDGSDAVTGVFSGLAEGASFTAAGKTWKITYIGGTGNDIVLSLVSTTAAGAPAAPNTGVKLASSNLAGRATLIGLIGLSILGLSRKFQKVSVRSRR